MNDLANSREYLIWLYPYCYFPYNKSPQDCKYTTAF